MNSAYRDDQALEQRLEADFRDACDVGKRQCKINATYFLRMLAEYGAIGAAKLLLAPSTEPQSGFTAAWECSRVFPRALDYTVEAIVWKPQFRHLFCEGELATAKARLQSLQHRPPWVDWP